MPNHPQPSAIETKKAAQLLLEIEAAHKRVDDYLKCLDIPVIHNQFKVDWGVRWHEAYRGLNSVGQLELNAYRKLYQYRGRWQKNGRSAVHAHCDLLRYGPVQLQKRDKTRLKYNKDVNMATYELYQAKRNLWVARYTRNHMITVNAIGRHYMLLSDPTELPV